MPVTPVVAWLAGLALRSRALQRTDRDIRLGTITLLPHQISAVHWLRNRLKRYGGALLADPPGLGKTYVALAIARAMQTTPLIIAPAALRERWHDAERETGIALRFLSTERLSAPKSLHLTEHALVIIDEAHHLRTPSTRRHERTATLCAHATTLLLSATPIHNRADDLRQLLTLFHMPPDRQSTSVLWRQLTLRRTMAELEAAQLWSAGSPALPLVRHRPPIRLRTPPVGPADALPAIPALGDRDSTGHVLLQLSLQHAMRSSAAAARRFIDRRIAATIAFEEAARIGVPALAELRRAWQSLDSDVQLAMAELLVDPSHVSSCDATLCQAAIAQREALERLRARLTADADRERALVLTRLHRWTRSPIVAFSQFAATARFFHRSLQHLPGVALLTGSGARIASGPISRAEAVHRLLGGAQLRSHERVRLLITTDVLSEGLSLAGVGTVVHLDLPWTPARLEQRIGRAARLGAPVNVVQSVILEAPLPAALSAPLRRLLRQKARSMQVVVADGLRRSGRGAGVEAEGSRYTAMIATLAAMAQQASRAPARGWVAVKSRHASEAFTLAVVRLRTRRLLVVLDADGLRSPRPADWLALRDSVVTARTPGEISRLRAALRSSEIEASMTCAITRPRDPRLELRREDDEVLLGSMPTRRVAAAEDVSSGRREAAVRSRRGDVEALSADDWRGDSVAQGRSREHPSSANKQRRIRIVGGVQVTPAADRLPA